MVELQQTILLFTTSVLLYFNNVVSLFADSVFLDEPIVMPQIIQ